MKRYFLLLCLALLTSCSEPKPNSANKPYFTTWEHYLGDPERTHFSNLDQIDTSNVTQLKLAWSYKSGGQQEGRTTQIQTSPLMVGNTLYGVNAAIELFAINAKTGKEIWKFSPKTKDESGLGLNRGLNYWKSDGKAPGRIFFPLGQNCTPSISKRASPLPILATTAALTFGMAWAETPISCP